MGVRALWEIENIRLLCKVLFLFSIFEKLGRKLSERLPYCSFTDLFLVKIKFHPGKPHSLFCTAKVARKYRFHPHQNPAGTKTKLGKKNLLFWRKTQILDANL